MFSKNLDKVIKLYLMLFPVNKHTYHDYTKRALGWGHSFTLIDIYGKGDKYIDAAGHGEGIERGHYIVVQSKEGGVARYKVCKIKYESNPRDMWFATIKYVRMTPEEGDNIMRELDTLAMYGGYTWTMLLHKVRIINASIENMVKGDNT